MSNRTFIGLAGLCLAVSMATGAQAQDNSSASSGAQTPAPAQPATKKVWTNDDVTDLRENSTVSTVGGSGAKQKTPSSRSAATGGRDANSYKAQIAKLEAQLPPLDAKIAELQAAIDGKFTGDSKTSTRTYGVKGGDWRVELAQLQQKRDGIAAQISALRDQARHAGVPANELP